MSGRQRPVVLGVDGSEGNDAAVRWAATEARTRGTRLRLVGLYRQDIYAAAAPMGAGWPADLPEAIREATRTVLDRAALIAADTEPTLVTEVEVIEGDPARELLTESAGAALLVVGSRHRQTLGSTLLGSVGAGVAPRAQCPVVVVRGPAGDPAVGAWTVAGVDGGPGDEEVLAYAFDHASRHGTRVRAVLCWHPHLTQLAHWMHEAYADARYEAQQRIDAALVPWRAKYPEITAVAAVIDDHPGAGLVGEGHGAHLLVVGTHGRHALTGTLLGSTSQAVLHHATCPVAVVHPNHPETTED